MYLGTVQPYPQEYRDNTNWGQWVILIVQAHKMKHRIEESLHSILETKINVLIHIFVTQFTRYMAFETLIWVKVALDICFFMHSGEEKKKIPLSQASSYSPINELFKQSGFIIKCKQAFKGKSTKQVKKRTISYRNQILKTQEEQLDQMKYPVMKQPYLKDKIENTFREEEKQKQKHDIFVF